MGLFKKKAMAPPYFYEPTAGSGRPVLQLVQAGSGHPLLGNVGGDGSLVLRPGEVVLSSWRGRIWAFSASGFESGLLDLTALTPPGAQLVVTDDRVLVHAPLGSHSFMLAEVPLVCVWEVKCSSTDSRPCAVGVSCLETDGTETLLIELEGEDWNAHLAAATSIARDIARRRLEAPIFPIKWNETTALTHIATTGEPTETDPDGPTRWWTIDSSVLLDSYPSFKHHPRDLRGSVPAIPVANPEAASLPAIVRPLQPHSEFTWVERIEYWPELDTDRNYDTYTTRESYPGPEYGLPRGENGEALPFQSPVKHFQFDRTLDLAAFSTSERWDDKEVYDVCWQTHERTMSVTLPGSSVGLDLSLDGRLIAAMAWDDGPSMFRIDTITGSVDQVASWERSEISGGEAMRWSPDGRTVLIARTSSLKNSFLVDMFSGAWNLLPWPGEATWWLAHSPDSVLLTRWIDGVTELSRGNLATGELVPLGPVSWPPALQAHQGNRHVYTLDVNSDGRRFVAEIVLGAATLTDEGRAGLVGGRTKWATGTLPLDAADPPPAVTGWASEWCWRNVPALELRQQGLRWCERARGSVSSG